VRHGGFRNGERQRTGRTRAGAGVNERASETVCRAARGGGTSSTPCGADGGDEPAEHGVPPASAPADERRDRGEESATKASDEGERSRRGREETTSCSTAERALPCGRATHLSYGPRGIGGSDGDSNPRPGASSAFRASTEGEPTPSTTTVDETLSCLRGSPGRIRARHGEPGEGERLGRRGRGRRDNALAGYGCRPLRVGGPVPWSPLRHSAGVRGKEGGKSVG
jgi:hypothetical protein